MIIFIQLSRTFCPWRILCKSIAGEHSPFSGEYFSHTHARTHASTLTTCSEQDIKIHWEKIPRPSPDKKRLALTTWALTELVKFRVFHTTEFFFVHSKQFPLTVNLCSQFVLSESHPDYFVLLSAIVGSRVQYRALPSITSPPPVSTPLVTTTPILFNLTRRYLISAVLTKDETPSSSYKSSVIS